MWKGDFDQGLKQIWFEVFSAQTLVEICNNKINSTQKTKKFITICFILYIKAKNNG